MMTVDTLVSVGRWGGGVLLVVALSLVGMSCGGDDAPPVCGNGVVERGQECDDGNRMNGDGCDAFCRVEPDWVCTGEPSRCIRRGGGPVGECGNGVVQTGQECDDGNTAAGDGCSPTCRIEEGWECDASEPSVCTRLPECGNGVIERGQQCDDGNTAAGDGCSSSCRIEEGWRCEGEPSVCTRIPVCGNGIIEEGEDCDDGNATGGDGCSSTCRVESGWECEGEPSVCTELPECGNGVIERGQQCDDGNATDGDGCSSTCQIEAGWQCDGEPSVCTAGCSVTGCSDLDTPCGDGVCNQTTQQCTFSPRADGASCDDGNLCTATATCQQGECVGEERDCAEVAGACTEGFCNPDTGECQTRALNEGDSCDIADSPCLAGTCTGGTCEGEPRADGEVCGEEACEVGLCSAGDCVFEPREDGTVCGEDECEVGLCTAGDCVFGPADDCTPCGEGGSELCAGGLCGGTGGTDVRDFADGQLPPDFTMGGNQPWRIVSDTAAVGGFALRSGAITHSQSSRTSLAVTLQEDGEVRFRRRVSSEQGFDFLEFFVDGTRRDRWSGNVAWGEVSFPLTAGNRTLEWRYVKDGSVSEGSDSGWIDDIRISGLPSDCTGDCGDGLLSGDECVVCSPVSDGTDCSLEDDPCRVGSCESGGCVFVDVADGTPCASDESCGTSTCNAGLCEFTPLEDCAPCVGENGLCADGRCGGVSLVRPLGPSFPSDPRYSTGGAAPWGVAAAAGPSGVPAAISGTIASGQESWMETTVNVPRAGNISFVMDVSIHSGTSGGLYDSGTPAHYAEFYLNGEREEQLTGEVRWRNITRAVQPGTHTLRWRYHRRDGSNSGRNDVRIANVVLDMSGSPCPGGDCLVPLFTGTTCLTCDDPVCE